MKRLTTEIKALIVFSCLLVLLLLAGQTFALIDYQKAISLGLQESVKEVGLVGVAFAKGFAFADTIIYIPLLIAGILGVLKNRRWGYRCLLASMAISIYWPLVHLYAIYIDRTSFNMSADKYLSFTIVLSLVTIYGVYGLWILSKNRSAITNSPPSKVGDR